MTAGQTSPRRGPRYVPHGTVVMLAIMVVGILSSPAFAQGTLTDLGPEPTVEQIDGALRARYELDEGLFTMVIGPGPLEVRRGETVEGTILAGFSSPPLDGYNITAFVLLPDQTGWNFSQAETRIDSSSESIGATTFTVQATPEARPYTLDASIRLMVIDPTGSPVIVDTVPYTISLRGDDLILGYWDNPFPSPLDNAFGIFLGNVAAWLVIALVTAFLVDPFLRMLTSRTETNLDDRIIRIIRMPVFIALFAFGLKQSLGAFVLPPWAFVVVDRLYIILLIIAIVYAAYRIWQEIILIVGKRLASTTETQLDDRLMPVFEKIGGFIIIVVGLFLILDQFGVNMTWFAAGGAVTSLVIAFAAQDTLSNFFSGIFLMLDQPFKEGDDIILDSGEVCEVTRIGLRTTDLYHRANHETIVVPNNMLATNRTINLLKPDKRYKVRVDIGVAYGTNVQQVKEILLDIMRSHHLTLADEDHQPFVRFQNFGASSLDFSVHGWVGDVYSRWLVASDIREMIDQRFNEAGIEIPFPPRVIWQGREEADRAAAERKGMSGAQTNWLHGDGPSTTHEDARDRVGSTSETGAEGDSGDDGGDGGGEP